MLATLTLDRVAAAFTPESAQRLIGLRLDPALRAELDDLRDRAGEGTLAPDEDLRYKQFIEVLDFIGILQAKAERVAGAASSRSQS